MKRRNMNKKNTKKNKTPLRKKGVFRAKGGQNFFPNTILVKVMNRIFMSSHHERCSK